MKQVRFIEETNGQVTPNGIRNQGRDVYEDKIKYNPTYKEPRLFTIVQDHSKKVRRRGKLTREQVLEQYPNATGFEYRVKATNKVYRSFNLKRVNHKFTARIGRGINI